MCLLSLFAGHFHHRVHVLGKPKAVSKKDKEKPQDDERKGTQGQMLLATLKQCCHVGAADVIYAAS